MILDRRHMGKHSCGFTLLEVLVSMFVVSILSLLLAVVFYQVMVIPPEQSVRLALNNEVGILSSQLYADVYMSENYSAGTSPYFGNFSWTDNASKTRYLSSYYFNSSRNSIVRNLLTYYPANNTSVNKSTTLMLTYHISKANFRITKKLDNVEVNITANATTRMGKNVSKEVTLYITPRPLHVETAEGGIWGLSPLALGTSGAGSEFMLTGKGNLFNGNMKVNGNVIVTGNNNEITGTLACNGSGCLQDTSHNANLSYQRPLITNCSFALPNIGVPQTYFSGTNLSAGIEVIDPNNNTFVFFGSNVNLWDEDVWQYKESFLQPISMLKPGMYYCNGTITIDHRYVRGAVTLVAQRIIIANPGASGWLGGEIQLEPYYEDLLLWATGTDGSTTTSGDGAILITGSAPRYPCVDLEGVLYAPNGEIELAGSGSTANSWTMAFITKGALVSKLLTISGDGWFIYRW